MSLSRYKMLSLHQLGQSRLRDQQTHQDISLLICMYLLQGFKRSKFMEVIGITVE